MIVTLRRDDIERELDKLHQQSFAWALACCRHDVDDAEDVLQMTYLKVLDGSARFEGRSTFQTWLFGVIRHTAASKWRKLVNRERLLRVFFHQQAEADSMQPDPKLDYPVNATRLLHAMKSLSQRQREVLQLVFYHGLSIEEASATLGISVGSARTHYSRGKRHLAGKLGDAEQ